MLWQCFLSHTDSENRHELNLSVWSEPYVSCLNNGKWSSWKFRDGQRDNWSDNRWRLPSDPAAADLESLSLNWSDSDPDHGWCLERRPSMGLFYHPSSIIWLEFHKHNISICQEKYFKHFKYLSPYFYVNTSLTYKPEILIVQLWTSNVLSNNFQKGDMLGAASPKDWLKYLAGGNVCCSIMR